MGKRVPLSRQKKRNKHAKSANEANRRKLQFHMEIKDVMEGILNYVCPSNVSEPSVSASARLDNYINAPDDQYDFTWGSQEEYEEVSKHELEVDPEPYVSTLGGYRIVDIDYFLNKTVSLQYEHSRKCTGGKLVFLCEKRKGFVSTFSYKCNVCERELIFHSEKPDTEHGESILNAAAVWATLSTGSTYSHLNEFMSILDIPGISGSFYFETQRRLGNVWKDSLWKMMESAGAEEHKIAKDRGDVDRDGIPFTTVLLDGGWSKRSYGHSYNEASGVAVIIGRRTGKVLFVGVRNKYCSICSRAENKGSDPNEHICFKNWKGSSGPMEADIVVEGFRSSISMHNLRYKKFIADGDSTVFSKIKQCVDYGPEVVKVECTNHCIKNYSKHLYRIKADTKGVSLSARKLVTQDTIKKLVGTAQRAIYANAHGDITKLKFDIRNSVNHVFGNHTHCSTYMCDTVGDVTSDQTENLKITGAHHHIYAALNLLLSKSHLLIDNETNNRAELFMSILARFNMGKRLNLIQRDGFQTRSFLTGLRYNQGPSWHTTPWKTHFKRSPGKVFKKYMLCQELRKQKRQAAVKKPRCVKKLKYSDENETQKDYGTNIAEVDLDGGQLSGEVEKLIERLKVTKEEQLRIATETIGQFDNGKYLSEKMHKLTASNFGPVFRRKITTSCDSLVKTVLNQKGVSTAAMDYGKKNESVAISKFQEMTGKVVGPSGLYYVDLERGFLGASPDGIINDKEIVEVKCSLKVASKDISLEDAVKQNLVVYLEIRDGQIRLKRNHNYYFQIPGQLGITGATTCYFIVYSGDKNNIFVENIPIDQALWNIQMLPKLESFYRDCLAPEIILNRRSRNLKCKDPVYVTQAQEKARSKKSRKTAQTAD